MQPPVRARLPSTLFSKALRRPKSDHDVEALSPRITEAGKPS